MQTKQFIQSIPYFGWVLLYCAVTWGIFGVTLGIVTPHMRDTFGVSFERMGTLMAMWAVSSIAGSLLGGEVAKRFAPRRLFLFYAGCTLLSMVALASAQTFAWLIAAFCAVAIFETALFTLGHGVLAQMSQDGEMRTRIIGLVDVGYSLGTMMAAPWVAMWFLWDASWHWPYVGFIAFVAVLLLLFVPRKPYQGLQWTHGNADVLQSSHLPIHASIHTTHQDPVGYLGLLKVPVVRLALGAAFAIGFVEWGQNFWLVSYLAQGLQWGESVARSAVFWLMAGMLLGRAWQTFLPSRLSMQQKLQSLSWLLLAAVLCQYLIDLGDSGVARSVLYASSLGVGLGMSVAFPILLGTMMHALPQEAARLSALMMIATALGATSSAQVIGRLADAWGMTAAFGVLCLASTVYAVLVWRLGRLRGGPPIPQPHSNTQIKAKSI